MLMKLVHVEDKERPTIPGLEDDGHTNHMPKPWRRITIHDFHQIMHARLATYQDYRMVTDIEQFGRRTWFDIHIYYDTTACWALAVARPNKWHCASAKGRPTLAPLTGIVWDEPTEYFFLGCWHPEHGYDDSKCRACGAPQPQFDSSD